MTLCFFDTILLLAPALGTMYALNKSSDYLVSIFFLFFLLAILSINSSQYCTNPDLSSSTFEPGPKPRIPTILGATLSIKSYSTV
jgi:hypothetical protein